MRLYETLLTILTKKGEASIDMIWKEVNASLENENTKAELALPYLRSLIYRKQEWFQLNGDFVAIQPERDLVKLIFKLSKYPGPEITITVDFQRRTFTYFEWNFSQRENVVPMNVREIGNVHEFQMKLYCLQVWNWKQSYQKEGIIIDGVEWSVLLETKGAIYKSEGLADYPKEWIKLCLAISKLTGVKMD